MAGVCNLAQIWERKKLCHSFGNAVDLWLAYRPGKLETRVQSPSAHPQNIRSPDSMAGVCNLAQIWERKKLCHSFGNAVDLWLAHRPGKLETRVQSPSAHPQNFPSPDSMAGVCNLACIWERKKLCHSFGNAVDLLLAVCMLVQEMADMLFHLGLTFGSPCTERSLVMGPLVLLIS